MVARNKHSTFLFLPGGGLGGNNTAAFFSPVEKRSCPSPEANKENETLGNFVMNILVFLLAKNNARGVKSSRSHHIKKKKRWWMGGRMERKSKHDKILKVFTFP